MPQHRRVRGLSDALAPAISRHHAFRTVAFVASLVAALAAAPAQAQRAGSGNWIDTWSASPQPVWEPDFFAPVAIPRSLMNQTIRQVARVSLGGGRVRVELSNEYGRQPLVIGAAPSPSPARRGATVPGSDRALTFGGRPSRPCRPARRS
jgi:hypothetical protein